MPIEFTKEEIEWILFIAEKQLIAFEALELDIPVHIVIKSIKNKIEAANE